MSSSTISSRTSQGSRSFSSVHDLRSSSSSYASSATKPMMPSKSSTPSNHSFSSASSRESSIGGSHGAYRSHSLTSQSSIRTSSSVAVPASVSTRSPSPSVTPSVSSSHSQSTESREQKYLDALIQESKELERYAYSSGVPPVCPYIFPLNPLSRSRSSSRSSHRTSERRDREADVKTETNSEADPNVRSVNVGGGHHKKKGKRAKGETRKWTDLLQDPAKMEELLADFERVDNIDEIPLYSYVRYVTLDSNHTQAFRLGGHLLRNYPDYVKIGNGIFMWNVQKFHYPRDEYGNVDARKPPLFETIFFKQITKLDKCMRKLKEQQDIIVKLKELIKSKSKTAQ